MTIMTIKEPRDDFEEEDDDEWEVAMPNTDALQEMGTDITKSHLCSLVVCYDLTFLCYLPWIS